MSLASSSSRGPRDSSWNAKTKHQANLRRDWSLSTPTTPGSNPASMDRGHAEPVEPSEREDDSVADTGRIV
jgi:hypothetical protein